MARTAQMSSTTNVETSGSSQEHISGRGWHGNSEGHAAAGRKGGSKVSQNRAHMAEIGRRGGSKVAQDRQHMADIGKKGGESK